MKISKPKYTSVDHWNLLDRVNCSNAYSYGAMKVLMRLLKHRNVETGLCFPTYEFLARCIFPDRSPKAGRAAVECAIKELKDKGVIIIEQQYNGPNLYDFDFEWGTGSGRSHEVYVNSDTKNDGEPRNNRVPSSWFRKPNPKARDNAKLLVKSDPANVAGTDPAKIAPEAANVAGSEPANVAVLTIKYNHENELKNKTIENETNDFAQPPANDDDEDLIIMKYFQPLAKH